MSDRERGIDVGSAQLTRGTLEFNRVVSLSDGVFAIAMTLLVFTLDASADSSC